MTDPTPEAEPTPTNPNTIFFGSNGLRAGWGLLTFILLLVAISFAASYTIKSLQPKTPSTQSQSSSKEALPKVFFLTEGLSTAAVLLVTFLMARIERRPFGTFGLGGTRPIAHFLQGLISGVFCLSLLVFTLHLTGYLHFDSRLLAAPAALRYALIWALGFTLVAFLEETLLRGYLQYTLARGLAAIYKSLLNTHHHRPLGFWTSALILSFVFGLGHGSNPGESPIGLLAAGLAGLVFSLALYRTGSLWWALGAHASWDWAQSFLYGVADSGTMVQGHLFATHPTGTPLLSGGLTGPEGSIFVLPTLALLAAITLLTSTPPLPRISAPADQVHSA